MYTVGEATKIIYRYSDKTLNNYHKNILDEIDNDVDNGQFARQKLEEFYNLLYLRRYFKCEIDLDYRRLADIVNKINVGLEILRNHLAKIPICNSIFITIVNAIYLIVPETIDQNINGIKHKRRFQKIILHISDLHFGKEHKYTKKIFLDFPEDERPSLLKELINDLKELSFIEKIDYVVLSGDLTWDGNIHDFNTNLDFLKKLSLQIGVPHTNFIIVPGNHDIIWFDPEDQKERHQEDAELAYKQFYELFYGSPPNKYLSYHVSDEHVAIVGLNSARLELKCKGIGYVGISQLKEKIDKMINGFNDSDARIRLAVLHHHLVPVSYIEIIPKKFHEHISMTLDSEGLIRELIKNNFKIILHGHQHKPFFSVERRIDKEDTKQRKEIIICGAGSISVSKKYTTTFGRNQYNLIVLTESNMEIISRYSHGSGFGFRDHLRFKEWF